jgi:hypothetical protein
MLVVPPKSMVRPCFSGLMASIFISSGPGQDTSNVDKAGVLRTEGSLVSNDECDCAACGGKEYVEDASLRSVDMAAESQGVSRCSAVRYQG